MQYNLPSKLVIDTISEQLKAVSIFIKSHSAFEINLANITHIDSAGIALLIELKNIAHNRSVSLTYTNVPNEVERLCKLYCITL